MTTSTVNNKRKQRLYIFLVAAALVLGLAGGPAVGSAEAGVDSGIGVPTTG